MVKFKMMPHRYETEANIPRSACHKWIPSRNFHGIIHKPFYDFNNSKLQCQSSQQLYARSWSTPHLWTEYIFTHDFYHFLLNRWTLCIHLRHFIFSYWHPSQFMNISKINSHLFDDNTPIQSALKCWSVVNKYFNFVLHHSVAS